ncbi:hypothetical protein DZC18_004193 [Clostridium beijerinckii]|nr:hypothetical protein [Clostridium beijerinckii]
MSILFKDDQFDFQVLRLLGEAVYCAADIGEVVSTSNRIKEGDYDSWCDEWTKTAERLHGIGNKAFVDGHLISAKKAYLRASNYYRAAEFSFMKIQIQKKLKSYLTQAQNAFRRLWNLITQ